ncbi:MAG: hypothetical protein HQM08_29425 [Candidatus Riflebacteria bacterium]|nr:hypothetical protein [Candidatus Riflebacteria bacterium]
MGSEAFFEISLGQRSMDGQSGDCIFLREMVAQSEKIRYLWIRGLSKGWILGKGFVANPSN